MDRFEFQRVETFLTRPPVSFGVPSSPRGSASLASLKARATGIDCLAVLKQGKIVLLVLYFYRFTHSLLIMNIEHMPS
jgi:hypothetical protein